MVFTTSIGKTEAADLKHDAAYVQEDSPTIGNMHFISLPKPLLQRTTIA